MDKKEISKYLGIIVVTMILSGGTAVIMNQDSPVYSCESKGIVSDCINGVKANGLRCYYDADNSYKYSYCAEGWKENFITQEKIIINKTIRANSYQCNITGCQI